MSYFGQSLKYSKKKYVSNLVEPTKMSFLTDTEILMLLFIPGSPQEYLCSSSLLPLCLQAKLQFSGGMFFQFFDWLIITWWG